MEYKPNSITGTKRASTTSIRIRVRFSEAAIFEVVCVTRERCWRAVGVPVRVCAAATAGALVCEKVWGVGEFANLFYIFLINPANLDDRKRNRERLRTNAKEKSIKGTQLFFSPVSSHIQPTHARVR